MISLRYSSATGAEGSKHGGRTVISGFFVALNRNALRRYSTHAMVVVGGEVINLLTCVPKVNEQSVLLHLSDKR